MSLFIFALLHREAIDEPGFRIAAIVFLLFICVLGFIFGKWFVELVRFRKRR